MRASAEADPLGREVAGPMSRFHHSAMSIFSVAAALGLIAGATPALPQVADPAFFATEGPVYALALSGDTLYLGGMFGRIGNRANGMLMVDPVTGADLRRAPPSSNVNLTGEACIPDGLGGWFVGGWFRDVAGLPRQNLVQVRADGSLSGWAPRVNGDVKAMARIGQTLYIAGDFTQVNDVPRSRLAAVDATSGALLPWNPAPNGYVLTIAATPTRVFVGGSFTSISGVARGRLAELDPTTGTALAMNVPANDWVNVLAVADSTLYVAGYFSSLGGLPMKGLGAIRLTTGTALAWAPALTHTAVHALALQDSVLYVGGDFNLTDAGRFRNGIAAFDTRSGALTDWSPPVSSQLSVSVGAIAATSSTVYLGGSINFSDTQREQLVALDAESGQLVAWRHGLMGGPMALSLSDSVLFVCGGMMGSSMEERKNLAAVDVRTHRLLTWAPRTNDTVMGLLEIAGAIFAAGYFDSAGSQPRKRLAAFDGRTGDLLPWDAGMVCAGGNFPSIATDGNQLFVGMTSWYWELGGQPRAGLGAVDLGSGLATPWNPGVTTTGGPLAVYSIALFDSTLYVGGLFDHLGGAPRANLGAVRSTSGQVLDWNPGANYSVSSIAKSGDFVYVAGPFGQAGGQPRMGLAKLDATTGQATPWNPGRSGQSYFVLPGREGVYVSGIGMYVGQSGFSDVALIDSLSGAPLAWDPQVGHSYIFGATSVIEDGPWAYIAGDFSYLSTRPSPGFGRLLPTEQVPPSVVIAGPTAPDVLIIGSELALTWVATDDGMVLSADLYLSRSGPGGPWELVAAGLPNIGSYRWRVTGPPSPGNCRLRLVARDLCGNEAVAVSPEGFSILSDPNAGVTPTGMSRTRFSVRSPARGTRTFEVTLTLARRAMVEWNVFDLAGRAVAGRVDGSIEPGTHTVHLPADGLPSGVYLLRLRAGREFRTGRVVLLR